MIALGLRYLTKYSVATDLARQEAEWPPHPGRIFMAMVSSYFEGGADPSERAALEWLEASPSPALRASEADERTTVRAYVPVNDQRGAIVGRLRQERAFPRTRPHDDSVYLIWEAEPTPEVRGALTRLCKKVTRVGHSMSAVQMWVVREGEEPEPNWLPAATSQEMRLRVAECGTLRSLELAFNGQAIQEHCMLVDALTTATGKEKTRLKGELKAKFPEGTPESRRPQLACWQGYVRSIQADLKEPELVAPFDEDFVIMTKVDGPMLGLESTLQLTGALRTYALKPAGKASPEWLSGHAAEGPSLQEHVAFFPLPYVGFEYADGHILGLGIAIPRNIQLTSYATRDEELRRYLGPLFFDLETGRERDIALENKGVWRWTLEREKRERPPLALRRTSWTRASRIWASVTPVVLHHHPKKREGDVERIVREAFASALLPEPESLTIRSVSAVQGAGHSMVLPPFTEGGANLCRFQIHVVARFKQKVSGPMLVGRGRFRGYGLFRPMSEAEANQ